MANRISSIDALKGFAIFIVVWGHSLQYLRRDSDFFDNPVFTLIYSFHMPLFFLLSGYFFSSSLKHGFRPFAIGKFRQLLVPCLTWAVIFTFAGMAFLLLRGKPMDWRDEVAALWTPSRWPFWFLKELFLSYVLAYLCMKLLKKEWAAFGLSMAIVLIVPPFEYQRCFLPVFWAGILLRKYQDAVVPHRRVVCMLSGLAFLALLPFWSSDHTIYKTGFPALFSTGAFPFGPSNAGVAFYRLVIGLCGSLFFFTLFRLVYAKGWSFSWLEHAGGATLAIYILQTTLVEKWAVRVIDLSFLHPWVYNLVATPIIAGLVVALCMYLAKWIDKGGQLAFLLLGSAYGRSK